MNNKRKTNNIYTRLATVLLMVAGLLMVENVWADGSRDLYPVGAKGYRAYLLSNDNAVSGSLPYASRGTHYVYAKVGEKIALASSEWRGNAALKLFDPDGNDVSPTRGIGNILGRIVNRREELAGPKLSASDRTPNRYTPVYYTVQKEGIHKVEFLPRTSVTSDLSNATRNGSADGVWSSWNSLLPESSSYIAAWDVTVINSTSTDFIPGRVYTNMLNMGILASTSTSEGFYGKFYVLTKDGYTYRVDNNGNNGIVFSFFVNNNGFVKGLRPNGTIDYTPIYKSLNYIDKAVDDRQIWDPTGPDNDQNITHKMFYTLPSEDLPKNTLVNGAVPGGKTWLKNDVVELQVLDVRIQGADDTDGQVSTKGGYIKFNTESQGPYTVKIESVGTPSFTTRHLQGTAVAGENSIYWDGRDGSNIPIPPGTVPAKITVQLQGAEVHFPYFDMEYNIDGIKLELLDHDLLPTQEVAVSDIVFWNDVDINSAINGSNANPINNSPLPTSLGGVESEGLSSAGLNGQPANGHKWGAEGNSYTDTFGDMRSMDTWTFVKGEEKSIETEVVVKKADLKITELSADKENVKIDDEITYTVVAGNTAGSSNVEGAPFSFILPPGFVYEGDLSDIVFTSDCNGTQSVPVTYDATTNTFNSQLKLPAGCEVTYTFKAKVTNQATSANTTATAAIMRPADVTDPDATNTSNPSKPVYTGEVTGSTPLDGNYYYHPTNPFFEVNNNGIENNVSNNIKDNQIPNFIDDIRADNDINQTPVNVPVYGNVLTNDYTSFGTLSVKSAEYYNNNGTLTALSLDSETTIYTPEGVEAGKITLKADGSYIFTPAEDFVGSVPVYYTAQNGTNSDDAKLTIKVIPEYDDNDLSNNKPVAHPDAVSTSKNTLITIDPRGNDNNPDGGALTVTEITYNGVAISEDSSNPTEIKDESNNVIGSAYRDGNNLVFTPLNDYIGEVPAFGYTIKNGENATDSSTITITVTETASTAIIVANDDTNSAPIGIAMAGSVKANDNWGDPLKNPKITEASVTIGGTTTVLTVGSPTTIPGAGTITLNPDGSYTYTSTVIGTIPVVYTVKNDDGDEDKATLYLTALNDCMDLVLFFEDFGVSDKDDGNFGRKTSPYMPSGSFAFGTPYPQSTKYDEYEIDNNHYAVVAPGYIKLGVDPNYHYFWTPAYNETGAVTDRSGTENGAVMVVNAGSTLDAFYQRKISVVSGESYRASFWLYLVNGPSQVSIDIMNLSTKEVLAVVTSPEMYDYDSAYKHKWTKFELYFTIPADLDCDIDELLLSFRNNKSENQGNDYYVDDIKLEQVCEVPDGTPTVEVTCPTYTAAVIAIDDFYETGNNTAATGNILENDIGLDGDVLRVTKVIVNGVETPVNPSGTTTFTTSEGGTVVIQPDGSFTYTPPADKNGIFDKFDYQVCNQNDICDVAEVILAVGICYEEVSGEPFEKVHWAPNGTILTLDPFTQPGTNFDFVLDIYELDNSFNMEINGTKIAVNEIEFQPLYDGFQDVTLGVNVEFADGTQYSAWESDKPVIYNIKGTAQNPAVRVIISTSGNVSLWGSKVSGGPLFPLRLTENTQGKNYFNKVEWNDSAENTIVVSQHAVNNTSIKGYGYGRNRVDCPNYWYGYNDNEWAENSNWTDNYVPKAYEDVEFATAANNSGIIQGMSGPGAGKGAADKDLHLDDVNQDGTGGRIIKDLINDSNKDLVITTTNQLIIDGKVHDKPAGSTSTGTIVVKADEDKATGTLIFNKPDDNKNVAAKVEFYNKAYTCPDCGFYRKQWQYFGIPVKSAEFPYIPSQNPLLETINKWTETVNGNKWVALNPANTPLDAFKGYEINNSNTVKPTHIYEFAGTLNVGDATVGLTKTTNVNYSGMNLLANSYTAAIPIKTAAIETGTVLAENTVYLFNTGTRDQWRKLNGGSITGVAGGQYTAVPVKLGGQTGLPDRILSMHSFMVNAASDKAQITLKYDQLVKNETGTNQPAWRSADNNGKRELPYIILDVIGEDSADRVWLFEESSTTRGYDNGWDGHKMLEGDLIQVFATDAYHNKYQVTTVPQLDNTTLGIAARENESYTISVATAADVEVRRLYLHDTFTGRGYLLKNGAEFVIPGTRSANQNRFKITASNVPAAVTEASTINTYVRDNVIVVENRSNENATVSVYDISGRFVGKAQIAKDEMKSFPELSIAAGVKVVKVVSDSGVVNRSDRVLLK